MFLQKKMINCSLWAFQTLNYYKCISYTSPVFFSLPCFTCLCSSTQGINTVKEMFFSPSEYYPSNFSVWIFYFIPRLVFPSTDWRSQLPSVWILLASILPYRCMLCIPASWKSPIYAWYSTNLPFFSFSSSFSFPLVFSPSCCCCRTSLQPTWAKPPAF